MAQDTALRDSSPESLLETDKPLSGGSDVRTKNAFLRQQGLDRPKGRDGPDLRAGKSPTHPAAGSVTFGRDSVLPGVQGGGKRETFLSLPGGSGADAPGHSGVRSRATASRFIREKAADKTVRDISRGAGWALKTARLAAVKEAGNVGGKAVKAAGRTTGKGAKTAERVSAQMVMAARQAAANSAKAKAIKDAAVRTAKHGAKNLREAANAVAEAAKAAIASLHSLIAALSAGGGVVLVVMVVICLIGLLVATPFGLFLSGQTGVGDDNIQAAVSRLTGEYNARLQEIQEDIPHDELDMAPDIVSAMTGNWKNVLAVYAVRVTTDEFSATKVVTMTNEKMEILRETFWDMNAIFYRTTRRTEGSGEDAVTIVTLHISPDTKDAEDMAEEYHFNAKQKKLLEELLSPEYDELAANLSNSILQNGPPCGIILDRIYRRGWTCRRGPERQATIYLHQLPPQG